nr:DNA-binding protein HEXBP-like [Onthophagus taurus]
MKAVTVQVNNKRNAERLTKEGKIRVGLAICRVERREEIRKCILCWSPLHIAKHCDNPNRKGCCYNCGEEGHQTKQCPNKERCPDCEKEGHRAGTGKCPIYRRLLQRARNVREARGKEKKIENERRKGEIMNDYGEGEEGKEIQDGGHAEVIGDKKRKKPGSEGGEHSKTESSSDKEDGNREEWKMQRMRVKKK